MCPLGMLGVGQSFRSSTVSKHADIGEPEWWIAGGISVFLILFAGIMSGLTLGLMSLGLVDLDVLQQSGSEEEKKQATTILPVVQKQHQLLVTLLLCNAAAMEALPIFLDDMFNEFVAVILSVTFVLAFGEVIPQAVCSRHGLAVGANFIWLVKFLMILCWPISYPVGMLLDHLLGHNDSALFRRAQLRALVNIHGKEAGKGGELTHDETTIIQGALDLTAKTALDSLTPLEYTFSLDINTKLDWETMGKIMARGHSRIPVYDEHKRNVVGLLLVKSLLNLSAEDGTPIRAVTIRRIPRVPSDMPLYDILNEFQKGGSHMAAVTKVKSKKIRRPCNEDEANQMPQETDTNFGEVDMEKGVQDDLTDPKIPTVEEDEYADVDAGEVIGIITLEDVMEELLQEEIVDETDEFIDVHHRIRVAKAAAKINRGGSLVHRVASFKRPLMGLSKQGQHAIKKVRQVEKDARLNSLAEFGMGTSDNLSEPLLDH